MRYLIVSLYVVIVVVAHSRDVGFMARTTKCVARSVVPDFLCDVELSPFLHRELLLE